MAKLTSRRIESLRKAVTQARQNFESFRKHRREVIQQLLGAHYYTGGDRVPINMLELLFNTLVSNLISGTPQALVSVKELSLMPAAATLEASINNTAKEIRLVKTLRNVVADAVLLMGVTKSGICSVGITVKGRNSEISSLEEQEGNRFHDYGQYFNDRVSPDDLVYDMTAHSFDTVQFIGNRYNLAYDALMKSDQFDSEVKANLKPRSRKEQDARGQEMTSALGGGGDDEYLARIEVYDLWLPADNLMVTFPAQPSGDPLIDKPLRTVEWDGPEEGPYHILAFSEVPDLAVPLAPVMPLYDLHELMNEVFTKQAGRAVGEKVVYTADPSMADDTDRIATASDQEIIPFQGQGVLNSISAGGVNPTSVGFVQVCRELFNYLAGNLDVTAGLSAPSETATQDLLLNRNASKRITNLALRTSEYIEEAFKDIAYYNWYDPLINQDVVKRLSVSGIEVPAKFTPESREGDFLQYNISIRPYAVGNQTPQQRLQTLMNIFREVILPLLPMFQQQGLGVDLPQFMKLIGKYTNQEDDLGSILRTIQPVMPQADSMGKPPVTSRNYTRKSVPGSSQGSMDEVMAALMSSGGNQRTSVQPVG